MAIGAALLVHLLMLPFDFANPAPSGSFGAPLPYVASGCRYCAITGDRLDAPALVVDLLVTATVFGMLSAITRARWLPLVVAIAAGYLALSEHEVILPESVLRDGVSFRLWVIAVIGYMIGCTASVALRFARRGAT